MPRRRGIFIGGDKHEEGVVFRLGGRVVTGHSQHLDNSQYLERDMSREYDSDSMESSPVWVRGPAVTSDGPCTGVGTDPGVAGGPVAPRPTPDTDLVVVPWDEVRCENHEVDNYAGRYRPYGALGPVRPQCAVARGVA